MHKIEALFNQLNNEKIIVDPNLTENDKISQCFENFTKARQTFTMAPVQEFTPVYPRDTFYGFSEFIFTSCVREGAEGPTLAECIENYNTEWVKNTNYFKMTKQGIQQVIIPVSAIYELTAFGAGWRNYGAMVQGNIKMESGTEIYVGIGQIGKYNTDGCGGTFVTIRENEKFIPIIIAGGAGGGNWEKEYGNGSMDQFGNRSYSREERNKNIGKGGKSGYSGYYNGGNGFEGRIKGNWELTEETPKSFEDGLNGGKDKDGDYE